MNNKINRNKFASQPIKQNKIYMELADRVSAIVELGEKIQNLSESEVEDLSSGASGRNPWFTRESVEDALNGISFMLQKNKIDTWLSSYNIKADVPKIIGLVMAGNIPLVGFHDLLCVLASGNFAAIKPSSDDEFLTKTIVDWILNIEPRFKKNIEIRDKLTGIDAVIATGSDNTSRYFEYYFKDVPHIIRKNRTSVAVLTGNESDVELKKLGYDIFSYFGLGCRNVSKIFTPEGYDLKKVLDQFEDYQQIANHNKYRNNYDYHKSIYLVNKTPHLDNGFLLILSSNELVSPVSTVYHQEYDHLNHLQKVLDENEEKIQCIVSKEHIPFGSAQKPELWDYADNVDVMEFLQALRS